MSIQNKLSINDREYNYCAPRISDLSPIFDSFKYSNFLDIPPEQQSILFDFLLNCVEEAEKIDHPEDTLQLVLELYKLVTTPIFTVPRVKSLDESTSERRKTDIEEAIKNESDAQKRLELKGKLIEAKTPRQVQMQITAARQVLGESTYLIQSWLMAISKSEYSTVTYSELSNMDYATFITTANQIQSFENIATAQLNEQQIKLALQQK